MKKRHPVVKVAERLGVSCHSLYPWMKRLGLGNGASSMRIAGRDEELRRLLAELKHVTEERNIPKKGRRTLCQDVRVHCPRPCSAN